MWVGGQRQVKAALPPGMTRYPLYRRMGGPQGLSRRVRKISPAPEFDPWTVKTVAQSLYRLSYLCQRTFAILHLLLVSFLLLIVRKVQDVEIN